MHRGDKIGCLTLVVFVAIVYVFAPSFFPLVLWVTAALIFSALLLAVDDSPRQSTAVLELDTDGPWKVMVCCISERRVRVAHDQCLHWGIIASAPQCDIDGTWYFLVKGETVGGVREALHH